SREWSMSRVTTGSAPPATRHSRPAHQTRPEPAISPKLVKGKAANISRSAIDSVFGFLTIAVHGMVSRSIAPAWPLDAGDAGAVRARPRRRSALAPAGDAATGQ